MNDTIILILTTGGYCLVCLVQTGVFASIMLRRLKKLQDDLTDLKDKPGPRLL